MSKGKLLAISLIWLVLIGVAAVAWRVIWVPSQEREAAEQVQAEQERTLAETSSQSAYDYQLNLGIDSFTGYAIFRTPEFRKELARQKIDLELVDDGADYRQRLGALRDGKLQMGLFPIDALVTSADGKIPPATVVAMIDETRGADAIVADATVAESPDQIDRDDLKIVLVPNSPSEMLLRLLQSQFHWKHVGRDSLLPANDAADVFAHYQRATTGAKQVYVTWEPFVSKMLENDRMVRVIDSGRFKGYIVDCLVAERQFLIKNPDVVERVVGSYFRVLHQYRDRMTNLVIDDAQRTGTSVSQPQAESLVAGIWWKNTLENFEHFGLGSGQLQLLEDMIENVVRVLLRTEAIGSDPTGGRPEEIYFAKILDQLRSSNFHPRLKDEQIREDTIVLPRLTESQWTSLVPIGELHVQDLVFPRGRALLTGRSERILDDDVIASLHNWPHAYLSIKGNASRQGDPELNQRLANDRADAALKYLVEKGIPRDRMRAVAGEPSGSMSVTFELGQRPY